MYQPTSTDASIVRLAAELLTGVQRPDLGHELNLLANRLDAGVAAQHAQRSAASLDFSGFPATPRPEIGPCQAAALSQLQEAAAAAAGSAETEAIREAGGITYQGNDDPGGHI